MLKHLVMLMTVAGALLPAASACAAAVVTDHVVSTTAQAQAGVPVTFGQVFKSGDVPRGAALTASIDGRQVALQVDAKAHNSDGSLRHAVLTVRVPRLAGDAQASLRLAAAGLADPADPGSVSLAQLLATAYDATLTVNIDGSTQVVHARSLLQAAAQAHSCKPWGRRCNQWLSGPLASAWVVHAPVAPSPDRKHGLLQVYFAVRAYAGMQPGSIAFVRTDVIVENGDAFAPQVQPRYLAALASGSARFASQPLTQYAYTRWHHVLWWNDQRPQVYLRQDARYLQASRAISRYMPLQPSQQFLASLRQGCPPLQRCDQTRHMGDTGAQPAIGPLPRWTSVYVVDPDRRAYRWMLANTDALGAYSIHYRDADTGWPVSIVRHPRATIANWAAAQRLAAQAGAVGKLYKADLLQGCTDNAVVTGCNSNWYATGNPNAWDQAHQPAESYVPYMVTGDYYYLSELAFGASHNDIWSNEAYRGYARGLIERSHEQVRAKAWVLRELADAAYLLPDRHPLKAEFNDVVDNALADWNRQYTDNPQANALGLMNSGAWPYSMHAGQHNAVAPWQHSFLTWSAGHAAELGFAGAARFRDWLAKFEIGIMTDWLRDPTHGYCWLQAAAYNVQVRDSQRRWLPDFGAVYAASFPSLVGLACNSPAMLATFHGKRKAGDMGGYAESPTGFPSNLQIGLAAIADSGLPNAARAWHIFQSRSVQPPASPHGYASYPNFALLPRSSSGP